VLEPSQRALEKGIRALSRRELSVVELRARLERAGLDAGEAEAVVTRLREVGYQSDERTARERAGVLAARNLGDAAIRADLESRGLGEGTVDAAVAALPPEAERAERVATRLSGEKLVRTLQRKGFGSDTIEGVVEAGVADRL
jgi:regulatory protein